MTEIQMAQQAARWALHYELCFCHWFIRISDLFRIYGVGLENMPTFEFRISVVK